MTATLSSMRLPPKKQGYPPETIEQRCAPSVRAFLKRFALHHFPDRRPDARVPYRQKDLAELIGVTPGYLSDVWNERKAPGYALVFGLSLASGTSVHDITGLRIPLRPKYPFTLAPHDARLAETAAEEAGWASNERPSGALRAAPVRTTRKG